jgi:N-methylhydantoinase A
MGAGFNLTAEQMALGIIRLANANMENTLKLVSVQRGYDPRDFVLVAFGGGGSMHAAALGRELHVKCVVIPRNPAVFSAWGMLMTDLRRAVVQTRIVRTDLVSRDEVQGIWLDLEGSLTKSFVDEGVRPADLLFQRSVDMRYYGQEHTVEVPFEPGPVQTETLRRAEERFHDLHEGAYTFRLPDSRIEIVNFRLIGVGPVRKPEIRPWATGSPDPTSALREHRPVLFEEGWQESAIYERDLLSVGARLRGPAVVEEPAASTLVPPGFTLEVDRYGNLMMEWEDDSGEVEA